MTTALIFDVANVIVDWDPTRALAGQVSDERIQQFFDSEVFWQLNARCDAGMPIAALTPLELARWVGEQIR